MRAGVPPRAASACSPPTSGPMPKRSTASDGCKSSKSSRGLVPHRDGFSGLLMLAGPGGKPLDARPPNTKRETLQGTVREHVQAGSDVYTGALIA